VQQESGADSDSGYSSDVPARVRERSRAPSTRAAASAWTKPPSIVAGPPRSAPQTPSTTDLGVRGVVNGGRNLCWFIALLQVLAATPGIVQDLADACLEISAATMTQHSTLAIHTLLALVPLLLAWHDAPGTGPFEPGPFLAPFQPLVGPAQRAIGSTLPQDLVDGEAHDMDESLLRLHNLLNGSMAASPGSLPQRLLGDATFASCHYEECTIISCPH